MKNLPKFYSRIKKDIVDPAIASQLGMKSATIIKSYPSTTKEGNRELGGGGIYVDVYIPGTQDIITGLPMLKMNGVEPSFPLPGTQCVIAFMDNDSTKPFIMGLLPTPKIIYNTEDNTSPTIPPRILSK